MRKKKILVLLVLCMLLSVGIVAFGQSDARTVQIDTGAYVTGYINAVDYAAPKNDCYTYKASQTGAYRETFSSDYRTYYINTVSGEQKKVRTGTLNANNNCTTGYVDVEVNSFTSGRCAYLSVKSGVRGISMTVDFD